MRGRAVHCQTTWPVKVSNQPDGSAVGGGEETTSDD